MLAAGVLAELLRVPNHPAIELAEMDNGVVGPPTVLVIGDRDDSPMVLFKIKAKSVEGVVGLVTYSMPEIVPDTTDDEVGLWASITVAATRSPFEFALAASVAIALAGIEQSLIIDNACLWTSVAKQSPDDFARTVAVHQHYNDLLVAAEAFYKALPVSSPR